MRSRLPSTTPAHPLPALTLPRTAGLAAVTAVLALLATLLPGALAGSAEARVPARDGIYWGVAGDVASVERNSTSDFAVHHYGFFQKSVPTGRMLTVRFQGDQSWRTTANLQPGSAGHADIARWADTIKNRSGEVFVAFHGEPENAQNRHIGTAEEFKAAWRKVVTIFRNRGATNVIWTWQMTSWAFRADSDEHTYAPDWYPGNDYVDVVGADPYNWYTCGHGKGKWNSLQTLVDPVLDFARARGKQVALPEFASHRDARRPDWIRQAGSYLQANDDLVAAVFYFNRMPTNSENGDCVWPLTSSGDYAAFREVAGRTAFKR